jgi:hypothetical protein
MRANGVHFLHQKWFFPEGIGMVAASLLLSEAGEEIGLLDYWIIGLLDYWIIGLLDYWMGGRGII